jgi:2-dehydro-3-deoxyphosphogluconate aldolase/(4S)-4-hydroxy-2-oxoglutarate aldolase
MNRQYAGLAEAALDRIGRLKVVPVVVIDDSDSAEPLMRALAEGGLACAEVAFRTTAAARTLEVMAQESEFLVGAGTIIGSEQLHQAIDGGAQFIVTPGFSTEVVTLARDQSVPVIPGVATATEIQMAIDAGLDTVKFFPAELLGGLSMIKALSAAFSAVRFLPTGGITAELLPQYLASRSVHAVGCSWMVPRGMIAAKDWSGIKRLVREAMSCVECAGR